MTSKRSLKRQRNRANHTVYIHALMQTCRYHVKTVLLQDGIRCKSVDYHNQLLWFVSKEDKFLYLLKYGDTIDTLLESCREHYGR